MLTEERHSFILKQVNQNKSVTLTELCELLGASESTIRRDLTALDEAQVEKIKNQVVNNAASMALSLAMRPAVMSSLMKLVE